MNSQTAAPTTLKFGSVCELYHDWLEAPPNTTPNERAPTPHQYLTAKLALVLEVETSGPSNGRPRSDE